MISLKIENLLFNNIVLNNKVELLKEGSVFTGKIVDLLDQTVFIDIKGHDTLQANLETNLKLVIGDEISFLVKSSNDKKIELKPLITDQTESNKIKESNSVSKLLYSFNIKETKLSIGLAENLMRYNAPITEQNLVEGIKNLEKLLQLANINDGEKVILINSTVKDITINEFTEQMTKITEIETKKTLPIENNNLKDIPPVDKEDIKLLLIVDSKDYPDKKDLTMVVKEFLGNENNSNIEDDYVKLISFFIKHNIKPSLNNIKNIIELSNNPIGFAEDFKQINALINKLQNGKKTENLLNNEENMSNKVITSSRDNKLYDLQKLIQNFDEKTSLQQKEDFKNIENKIEFLKDMNKDLSFLFLPIHYGKEGLDGILTLFKDQINKKTVNNKINVFINVNTKNLGNIKVSCQVLGNSINIKMNIKNEDLELFKLKEKHLIEKILSIGYILNKVEYITNDNLQIIDSIVSNPNPRYILDLKV